MNALSNPIVTSSNIKISIFSTTVLSEMIRFLVYLHQVLSQFQFKQRNSTGFQNLIPMPDFLLVVPLANSQYKND